MSNRRTLIGAIGAAVGIAAISAGVAWGFHLDYPAPSGERDLPVSTILLNVLAMAVPGFALFAVSLWATAWQPRFSRSLILAVAAALSVLAIYVAIDVASQADQPDEGFFFALLALGYLMPIAALGLASLYSAGDYRLQGRRARFVVNLACLILVVAAAGYALWFHENRSYGTGGNWWYYIGIFAWSSGWALAILALTLPGAGAAILRICQAGGVLLLVVAAGYAFDLNGDRDVLWVLSGDALRIAALGSLVLLLSGVRAAPLASVVGLAMVALALYQGYDTAAIYRRSPINELWIWPLLRTAVVPAALGAMLVVVSETRPRSETTG